MKNVFVVIVVLGLTVTARAQIQFNEYDSSSSENVLLTDASVIVIDIRADEGLVIVSGEPAGGNGQCIARPAAMNTATSRLLPEPMTIALLGLAGLLYRRQAGTGAASGVSIMKAR